MFYNLSTTVFLKKSTNFDNLIINYFLIHKTYIKCFFSLFLSTLQEIFFTLPKNVWFRVFGRKRALILYTLNYSILRNIILKLRSFYPMSLYKLRGSL
jgi:hypothetical protein